VCCSLKARGSIGSVALALLLTTGCANRHARTATVIELPQPLAVPAPPPRVILPPQPETPEPVEEPQPTNPTRPRPRTQGRPTTEPKTDVPKTEAPPQTPPPAPEPQPPEKPNQDLQPADAAGENAIRQQIGRARQDLKRVNYAGLSADMKTQYDQANRFLALSEQNLKEHNLLLASTLADKAGAIAEMLTRR
jgi:outer membrane biosynthesis protein TonB